MRNRVKWDVACGQYVKPPPNEDDRSSSSKEQQQLQPPQPVKDSRSTISSSGGATSDSRPLMAGEQCFGFSPKPVAYVKGMPSFLRPPKKKHPLLQYPLLTYPLLTVTLTLWLDLT